MPLLVAGVLLVLAVIVLIPFSIVQRFRAGTRRRPARRWVATANLIAVVFSVVLFVVSAFFTSFWVPTALTYTLTGVGVGGGLGLLGLAVTRWEAIGGRWHFTPNRVLVLTLTIVIAVRVLYGVWRAWDAWQSSGLSVAASGLAMSMSAGAVVLGYYLVFWAGIRWRTSQRT